MNDRLKYRLWAKDIEMYFKGALIYNNTDGKLVAEDGVKVYEIDQKAYIVEQCTGLKDKNGKLIYENDLITKDNTIYRVDWCQDKLGFVLRNESNPDDTLESLDITINKWEVIGNIHENKELLDA